MYKACKTELSAARQRDLEVGLMEQMLIQHYDEITVSSLCQKLQIPRKAFYRYFSGKDGALRALIDHTLLEYERMSLLIEHDISHHQDQLAGFFVFWRQHSKLLDALAKSGLSGLVIEASIEHALSDESIFHHFSGEKDRTEIAYATMFAICGLMSMMLRWHKEQYPVPEERMAQIALSILTNPLKS